VKKINMLAIGAVTVGVLITGCGTTNNTNTSSPNTSGNATTSSNSGGKTIGFANSTLNNPYFVAMQSGVKQEAQKDGLKVVYDNANNDAPTQLNQVEDLIQQHVSVILLNPVDSQSLSSAVKAANKANIPVITLDRSVNGGKVATFIASDSVLAGKQAADQLIKALGGKGNVVELQGTIGASSEIDRENGFDKEIATAPGIKIVAKQSANFDRSTAMNVMQNILQANPNVSGVFAQNDEMALGALQAIQQSGKKGIAIVGIDGEQEAINNVNNGKMYADIAQQPAQEGVLGVDNALKIINGQTIPKTINSPLQLITKGSTFKGF
jgi:ribose transport system substrate-binding protein